MNKNNSNNNNSTDKTCFVKILMKLTSLKSEQTRKKEKKLIMIEKNSYRHNRSLINNEEYN